jgi:hypothetical protein
MNTSLSEFYIASCALTIPPVSGVLGRSRPHKELENAMDEAVVWIPSVKVCRHERTADFTLMRFGTVEGSGVSYVVGPLVPVTKEDMAAKGLDIIKEALRFYREWPAETKFNSEFKTMGTVKRSKFITQHRFVNVLQRDKNSISLGVVHREGRGWRGMTSYAKEEKRFTLPITHEQFYEALMQALEAST